MTQRRDAPTMSPVSGAQVERVLQIITTIPRAWSVAMVVAAVVSSVDVAVSSGKAIAIHLHVGVAGLIALALIWLPALVRVLALTGGSLRAGGVTATTGGLLGREDLVELLSRVKGVTSNAEPATTRESAIKELDDYAERIAADHLAGDNLLTDEQLRGLAIRYERLRQDSPPGPRRTSDMTRIVNEARVRAASSPRSAGESGRSLLRSMSQGDRIVGLALVQESRDVAAFTDVVGLIASSASAFEMFHALLALQELALSISPEQRMIAVETLRSEIQDPRGVDINGDPALPSLIARTLSDLQALT